MENEFEEELDFEIESITNVVNKLKVDEEEVYDMYKESGLSDLDIYQIVTAESMGKIYNF